MKQGERTEKEAEVVCSCLTGSAAKVAEEYISSSCQTGSVQALVVTFCVFHGLTQVCQY